MSNADPIRVGLVGCGGRGTGAAENILEAADGIEITVLADLFKDRIDGCRKQLSKHPGFKVTDDACFAGFDAYEKLLASKIDLVLLATPPGFRPIHFEAAVKAGKHVFMEKPVAVDPVGVRRVLEAGVEAGKKKLAVVAGTQRRHQAGYIDSIKRIHDGEIGSIVSARVYWNMGGLWVRKKEAGWSDMEWQCRNWLYHCWLSGDHIVEQHIHNLDVANWILKSHPLKATGMGGRAVRTAAEYGNIFDHFTIDYEYPGGVHVYSMCRQWAAADVANHIGEIVVGSKGTMTLGGGAGPNPYVQEHVDLIASIRAGTPLNETKAVAESTLTAIMGREAAYTGKEIEWIELLSSELTLSPEKYEFGEAPNDPVPVPGKGR